MNIEEYIASMDPELRAGFIQIMPFFSQRPSDPVAARKWVADLTGSLTVGLPADDRVQIQNYRIPGPTGAPDVPVRVYTPTTRAGNMPGLLYIHGGGFTIGNLESEDAICRQLAHEVGCVVVSVDYRLAPEHPFPAAPEDCYAALTWMATNAQPLSIDPSRIGVRGSSSGGGLCAAVTLMARDRKTPSLIFQMPLYACLDDRHVTPSSHQMTASEMIWGRPLSLRGWKAYLGDNHPDNISAYAAPARAEDLSGLPLTYMMVGEMDLLRDENIAYAMRLMQAGVPTELHVYPGAFHGFEGMVKNASMSIRAVYESTEALKRGLGN